MTPQNTAAPRHRPASHAGRGLRRGSSPRAPRRVSGPTRPALAGATVARPPFSMRLGARAMRVGDARLLDRLVRGRAWIALVAIGLLGIVFMQVSLLKLNAGISRAVTAADTLERQNANLRGDISNLDSGERIQDVAAKLGMVTPAAGDVHYLDGREANGARAAASIKPPASVSGAPTTTTPAATTTTQAAVTAQQQPAPAAQQQQPAAATQQQPVAVHQQPAQTAATTQQPAAGTPAGGATSPTTAPPAATAPNTAAAAAGGASASQGGTTAPQGG